MMTHIIGTASAVPDESIPQRDPSYFKILQMLFRHLPQLQAVGDLPVSRMKHQQFRMLTLRFSILHYILHQPADERSLIISFFSILRFRRNLLLMILCSAIFSNVWIILFHLALYLFYSISYHIFQLFLSTILPEILIHSAILQRFYTPFTRYLILHKKYSFS